MTFEQAMTKLRDKHPKDWALILAALLGQKEAPSGDYWSNR